MAKHKTKEEWIKLFKKFESGDWDWDKYYVLVTPQKKPFQVQKYSIVFQRRKWRENFKAKYKLWKMLDNKFMEKKIETRGRKPKRNLDEIINNLTDQEKEDIVRRYLEIQEKKKKNEIKKESNTFKWTISKKAFVFGLHRTTYYKNPKKRIYKFDYCKKTIVDTFNENLKRYGSERLSMALVEKGISINERTLRNYMDRWGLVSITRTAKRVGEKKFKIYVPDLVNRDYHGKKVNAKATDVSYIPADEIQNFVYLSATIDHRTKFVHWYISKTNNMDLVMRTQMQISETNYTLHSDHAWQYFNKELLDFNQERNIRTSMKSTNDPLDNREIEYFFGCIKTECLHHIKTKTMKFEEIKEIVREYIEWYNTKRIQKRLQWKTPVEARVMQSNV